MTSTSSTLVEDSGTETLFSDDSPCDLGSPTIICRDETVASTNTTLLRQQQQQQRCPPIIVSHTNNNNSNNNNCSDVNARLAPPNIQPYSGVLERSKVHVIRPIAFKPSLNPASRFGLAGERYGSTPILTRPGSRLTLYGSSNDLRQSSSHQLVNAGSRCSNNNGNNYSLDRKLRTSCQSAASSPPLAMSSLTSLPHKLQNYDSLESVAQTKSPVSLINKNYRLVSATGESIISDLTPSPSDSGVSELEAALRDRDSELAYLRQTMEHNEQVIFRVYQEKERSWEREIRRLKNLHESNVRNGSQKVFKMEQLLMMQNYQFQQEKKRLIAEMQRANCQNERLAQEVKMLKERLEETEWNVCQKTGEISLLKSQLKDVQSEQTAKSQEFLQMRNDYRDAREVLDERECRLSDLRETVAHRDEEIAELRKEVTQLEKRGEEPERLRREIEELRAELSEVSMSEYEGMEPGRLNRNHHPYRTTIGNKKHQSSLQSANNNNHNADDDGNDDEVVSSRRDELDAIKSELDERKQNFERERLIWAQEKENVLRYQKQLQMNYIQMYRRTRALESEVESLSVELELDKTGMKPLPKEKTCLNHHLSQTIEL